MHYNTPFRLKIPFFSGEETVPRLLSVGGIPFPHQTLSAAPTSNYFRRQWQDNDNQDDDDSDDDEDDDDDDHDADDDDNDDDDNVKYELVVIHLKRFARQPMGNSLI